MLYRHWSTCLISRNWTIGFCLSAVAVSAGCSKKSGPDRFDVQGTVIYDGKPLESGRITFAPDSDQGNRGPAGYAFIQNGKYDTTGADGKSPVSGPMKVLMTGYNNGTGPNQEALPPLFEDYTVSATVDPEKARQTLDFDVPFQGKKTAARK